MSATSRSPCCDDRFEHARALITRRHVTATAPIKSQYCAVSTMLTHSPRLWSGIVNARTHAVVAFARSLRVRTSRSLLRWNEPRPTCLWRLSRRQMTHAHSAFRSVAKASRRDSRAKKRRACRPGEHSYRPASEGTYVSAEYQTNRALIRISQKISF